MSPLLHPGWSLPPPAGGGPSPQPPLRLANPAAGCSRGHSCPSLERASRLGILRTCPHTPGHRVKRTAEVAPPWSLLPHCSAWQSSKGRGHHIKHCPRDGRWHSKDPERDTQPLATSSPSTWRKSAHGETSKHSCSQGPKGPCQGRPRHAMALPLLQEPRPCPWAWQPGPAPRPSEEAQAGDAFPLHRS